MIGDYSGPLRGLGTLSFKKRKYIKKEKKRKEKIGKYVSYQFGVNLNVIIIKEVF